MIAELIPDEPEEFQIQRQRNHFINSKIIDKLMDDEEDDDDIHDEEEAAAAAAHMDESQRASFNIKPYPRSPAGVM